MKNRKQNAFMIILMVVVLIVVFNNNYSRKRKAELNSLMENARASFARNNQYDSSYAKNDTVRFYNNGSYIGLAAIMSEAETDTVFCYRGDSLVGMSVVVQK